MVKFYINFLIVLSFLSSYATAAVYNCDFSIGQAPFLKIDVEERAQGVLFESAEMNLGGQQKKVQILQKEASSDLLYLFDIIESRTEKPISIQIFQELISEAKFKALAKNPNMPFFQEINGFCLANYNN